MSRAEFIRVVTADQPDSPAYFTYDAVLNTKERPTLDEALAEGLTPLSLDEVLELAPAERRCSTAARASTSQAPTLRGAINIGLDGSYATWAGTLLDHEKPIVIVVDPGREEEARIRLGRIGFDDVAGYLEGGMLALDGRPDLIERIERITAATLEEQLCRAGPPLVVDVRAEDERSEASSRGASTSRSASFPSGSASCRGIARSSSTARAATGPRPPRACSNARASSTCPIWSAGSAARSGCRQLDQLEQRVPVPRGAGDAEPALEVVERQLRPARAVRVAGDRSRARRR